MDGTREVVYEVVYADGELVWRQAVAEQNNTSVTEYAYVGTSSRRRRRVTPSPSVVKNSDGSGYLLRSPGDALHFTGLSEVKCTIPPATTAWGTCGHDRAPRSRALRAVDKSVIPLGTTICSSPPILHLRYEPCGGHRVCAARRSTCSWTPTTSASSSTAQFRRLFFSTESMKKPRAAALGFLFSLFSEQQLIEHLQ